MTFHWFLSYQNLTEYNFSGGRIEVHREICDWTMEYRRRDHNGDADSFKRNVLDAIGGAVVRWSGSRPLATWNRWDPDLYAAFVAHLVAANERDAAHLAKCRAEHPDINFPDRPFVIPRPIYWDMQANHWQTEPWFAEQAVAA